ncbi:DNA-binding SARP family transcriptional activator [Streptomyces sp. BK208]|uniref:AfsR/SARP family transcriptional regulator n=1 Tax=Streptomyces sp. BK208 TaxID=2512150 RepID=UPI0010D5E194|nr:AfsR/SARP family transcriptional regulator [Streptomyces sp. BK208]TDT42702.1 DNA-binding SARP family transcriptional activator [Streptomyces sp. BK208]
MSTTGETLRIQLLGPVRAWQYDEEVRTGPPKQRAVLGLLAGRGGEVVCVEHIIDGVWGTDTPQSAAGGVHTYVAGLRRVLDPDRGRRGTSSVLASAAGGYCLSVTADEVDALLFARRHATARRAAAEGDTARALTLYGDALSLWRGSAYSGVPGPFAAMERTRLQDLRFTAIEEWAQVMLADGRHAEAVPELSAAVSEEPLREKLRWLLMLALYRSDRQAHALSVYAQTRQLLSRELGIEPGAELQSLHQQILTGRSVPPVGRPAAGNLAERTGTPAALRVRPAQLPALARGFVGRTTELARMEKLLDESCAQPSATTTVVVADGAAGVGKTAFVLRLAHRLLDRFPDGQLYVDLCGTSLCARPLSAAEALAQLLRGLGTEDSRIPADLAGRASLYRSLLHGRRMLVVLDDAVNADQLRPLIPRGPSCVLATSRQRLTGLAVRDGAQLVRLGPLDEAESVRLLSDLGGGRLHAQDPVALRLVRLCGGLPLALRIAAEQLAARPNVSAAALAEQYSAERGRLDRLAVEDDAATSVRTVFESSYLALPAEAARMFRYLGLHRGDVITVGSAAALSGVGWDTARPLLDLLVESHLLDDAGRQTFRFHDLIRIFAAECAEREPLPLRQAALTRLLQAEQRLPGRRAVPVAGRDAACAGAVPL